MLSRVADSLYWMGRYLERAENIARLLLVTEDFSTETQGFAEDLAQGIWKDLLAIFPAAQMTRAASPFAPLAVPYLHGFFLDAGNPYSIHFSVRKARENARSVREALTLEAFLAINETYHALETYETPGLADLPALRAALKECLEAIAGPGDLTPPARLVGRLHAGLYYGEGELMREADYAGLLDRVSGELSKVHDALAALYFVT